MGARLLAPRPPWHGRRIVLGITGGIAAYKSVQLARDLTRLGAGVDVILTEAAARFVTPLTLQGVTGRPVLDSLWSVEGAALHIRLGAEADLVLVAPATADFLARAASGRADDLLTTVLLATRAPLLVAPAMNDRMWDHPLTRANVERLQKAVGCAVAGPGIGPLAAGEGEGPGRMLEPEELVEEAGRLLGREPAWEGKRVLLTAGPTREALDPVRYLGNRSSGRMGWALAREAWLRGAEVQIVSGPVFLPDPRGIEVTRVESAREMLDATRSRLDGVDLVIYAAAVADFRPDRVARSKLSRREGEEVGPVVLAENPDIARELRTELPPGTITLGFALETEGLRERAAAKLREKGFTFIAANPAGEAGAGFESKTNRVILLGPGDSLEEFPLASKSEIARHLLDRLTPHLQGAGSGKGAAR